MRIIIFFSESGVVVVFSGYQVIFARYHIVLWHLEPTFATLSSQAAHVSTAARTYTYARRHKFMRRCSPRSSHKLKFITKISICNSNTSFVVVATHQAPWVLLLPHSVTTNKPQTASHISHRWLSVLQGSVRRSCIVQIICWHIPLCSCMHAHNLCVEQISPNFQYSFQYVCWQSSEFMSAAAVDTLPKLLLGDLITFRFLFSGSLF